MRRYGSPALVMRPRRCSPPELYCPVTRPSQADNWRPHLNSCARPMHCLAPHGGRFQRQHNPELREQAADAVDRGRALLNEALAGTVHRQLAKTFFARFHSLGVTRFVKVRKGPAGARGAPI